MRKLFVSCCYQNLKFKKNKEVIQVVGEIQGLSEKQKLGIVLITAFLSERSSQTSFYTDDCYAVIILKTIRHSFKLT